MKIKRWDIELQVQTSLLFLIRQVKVNWWIRISRTYWLTRYTTLTWDPFNKQCACQRKDSISWSGTMSTASSTKRPCDTSWGCCKLTQTFQYWTSQRNFHQWCRNIWSQETLSMSKALRISWEILLETNSTCLYSSMLRLVSLASLDQDKKTNRLGLLSLALRLVYFIKTKLLLFLSSNKKLKSSIL